MGNETDLTGNNIKNDIQGAKMRVEVLVAGPPTKKCKQVMALMEILVIAFPGRLKIDVYYAGSQMTIQPTKGFQSAGKFKKIPSTFVNGISVASGEIPDERKLKEVVAAELEKGVEHWAL